MSVGGTFKLEKSENIDGLLKTLGVPEDKIEKYTQIPGEQTVDVKVEGKNLKMVTTYGTHTSENTLTVGEVSTYKLFTGTELQVKINMPENNVAKGTFNVDGKQGEVTVEFGSGELTETFTFGGVTAKRIFKRI